MKSFTMRIRFFPVLILLIAISLSGCKKDSNTDTGIKAAADGQQTIEGKVTDVFNSEESGESYVTIETKDGVIILDCKNKGFDNSPGLNDVVKVNVQNIRQIENSTVGDLISVVSYTESGK